MLLHVPVVLLTETIFRVYSPRRFVTDVPHLVNSAIIFLKGYFGTAKLLLCVGQYNCSHTTRTPIKTVLGVCAAAWFFWSCLSFPAWPARLCRAACRVRQLPAGHCWMNPCAPLPLPAPHRGKSLDLLEKPPFTCTVFVRAFSTSGCWGTRRLRPANGTVPAAARRALGVMLSPVCWSSRKKGPGRDYEACYG